MPLNAPDEPAVVYSQNGNYLAIAGLGVVLLSKIGVSTDITTLMAVAGGVIGIIGIVKQFIAHKNIAVAVGAIRR